MATTRQWFLLLAAAAALSVTSALRCTSLRAYVDRDSIVTSPGYPYLYAKRSDCWVITSFMHGYQVRLRFLVADIGRYSEAYVEIYDGDSSSSRQIGTYTYEDYSDITSTGENIYIFFGGDNKYQRGQRGFKIDYRSVGKPECTHLKANSTSSNTLTSPNYPSRYTKHFATCWIITANPRGNQLWLQFLHFDLESNQNCASDFVEIRDGSTLESPLIGERYCGSREVPDATSSGDEIFIYFEADSKYARTGFNISYQTVPQVGLSPREPQNTAARSGESARLECGGNKGSDMVTWAMRPALEDFDTFIYQGTNNGFAVSQPEYYMSDTAKRDDVIIKNASQHTAGLYSCFQYTNGRGSGKMVAFNVLDSPQCNSTQNSFSKIYENSVDLECSVTYWGAMKPRLTWMDGNTTLEGEVVEDSDNNRVPPWSGEQRLLKLALHYNNTDIENTDPNRDDLQLTCVVSFSSEDQDSVSGVIGPVPDYIDSCSLDFKTDCRWYWQQ